MKRELLYNKEMKGNTTYSVFYKRALMLFFLSTLCVFAYGQRWERGMFIGGPDHDRPSFGLVPSANGKMVFGGSFGEYMLFNGNYMGGGTTYYGHYGSSAKLNHFLTEVDSNGVINWIKIISQNIASTASPAYITNDRNGNIYVIFGLVNTTQATFPDASLHTITNSGQVLFKFNSTGNIQWYKELGGNVIQGLSTDKYGNVYIAGHRDSYSGNSITIVDDFTFAYTGLDSPGFLLKLSGMNGSTQWGKVFNKRSLVKALVVDSTDHVYMQGTSTSSDLISNATLDFTDATPDIIVPTEGAFTFWLKYKTDGSLQWAKQISAGFAMTGINKEGTLLVVPQSVFAGLTYTYDGQTIDSEGKNKILNALVDSAAHFVATPTVVSERTIEVLNAAFNSDGYYFTIGRFAPETAFGDSVVPDRGNNVTDGFLLKYNADGELLWVRRQIGLGSVFTRDLNFSGDYVYTISPVQVGVIDLRPDLSIISEIGLELNDIFFARLRDCNATLNQNGLALEANTGLSYKWYRDGAVVTSVTSQNYTPTYNGRYQVEVTFAGNCKCKTASIDYDDGITATIKDEVVREGVSLFPNPAQQFVHVQAPKEAGSLRLELVDAQGRTIWTGAMEQEYILSLKGMSSGLYTLMAYSERGFWQERLVVNE